MAQSLRTHARTHARIGVYVNGFNLYYGAKGLCGPDPGWKWLDIRVATVNPVNRESLVRASVPGIRMPRLTGSVHLAVTWVYHRGHHGEKQ